MLRLFVGIELPVSVRQRLTDLQCDYAGARWHAAEQLHLTLNFIGSFDGERLPELATAVAGVAAAPLTIQPRGVGYFGAPERPLVVWAGVAPSPQLQQLYAELENRLVPLGVEPEDRHYTPHITLARVRQSEPLADFLRLHAGFSVPPFTVEQICLFLSSRGEHGAEYRVIQRFPLMGCAG